MGAAGARGGFPGLASGGTRRLVGVGLTILALLAGCAPASSPVPAGGAARGSGQPPPADAATSPQGAPGSAAAVPSAPPTLTRARIAYSSTSPPFLVHFVADALGLYRQYGLESESLAASPAVSIPGLTSGEIDYVLSIGSLMRAAAKGAPVRALAVYLPKPNFFLLAQPTIQQGSDLRGKVLGVTGYGGNSHVTAQLYVSSFGLDPQHDVQYLNLGEEPVLWESLRLGRIDGAPMSPPYPALGERAGMTVLAGPDDLAFEYPFTGVGTSQEKIATQHDAVKRMLKAHLATLQAMQSDRDAVVRVMVERLAIDPEIAAATYDQTRASWSRDGSIARQGVETLQRLDVESGALEAVVPFEQIVDASVLAEALRELGR